MNTDLKSLLEKRAEKLAEKYRAFPKAAKSELLSKLQAELGDEK